MVYKLSPTSLGLMDKCPRCFWLEKHEIWKRPEGIFPTLPNGMDRILKRHFDNFRDKQKLPPELCDNHNCSEMRLFGYSKEEKELLNVWRDNRKGVVYENEDGNILFGAVDNILVKDGKLIVIDYKTRGYAPKEDTHEYYKDQLNIYTFLLRKNGYETEDYGFILFYFPKEVLETGEVIFDTQLVKIKLNPEDGEKIFRDAVKLLNGSCPIVYCEWCEKV